MLEMASPTVISNFARPGSALLMLSRFFSSIAVTEFSFSSVGRQLAFVVVHQSGQLLGHRRRVGQQVDDLLSARHQDLKQIVGVEDELVDLLAAFGQDSGDIAGTLEQLAQGLGCGC